MLIYESAQKGFTLTEDKNNEDYEFTISIQDTERFLPLIRRIREHFDKDSVYTDVLFYARRDHEYHIIVRQDYYVDFILCLFKYRFVQKVAWA